MLLLKQVGTKPTTRRRSCSTPRERAIKGRRTCARGTEACRGCLARRTRPPRAPSGRQQSHPPGAPRRCVKRSVTLPSTPAAWRSDALCSACCATFSPHRVGGQHSSVETQKQASATRGAQPPPTAAHAPWLHPHAAPARPATPPAPSLPNSVGDPYGQRPLHPTAQVTPRGSPR